MYIEISKIISPKIKHRSKIDGSRIKELAQSISEVGMINPIQVKKINGKYEIIAGERRYLACKEIGIKKLKCEVVEKNEGETEEIKLAENIMREDLNPIELAKAIIVAQQKFKVHLIKIAKALGKTTVWIEKKINLLGLPQEIQDAIAEKLIAEKTGVELARIDEDIERKRLLSYAIAHGATWKVVNSWVESYILGCRQKEREKIEGEKKLVTKDEKEILVPCLLCGNLDNILKMEYVPVHPECKAELFYKIKVKKSEEDKGV